MVLVLDERTQDDAAPNWTLLRVAFRAVGTFTLVLCGLEVWAELVGPL